MIFGVRPSTAYEIRKNASAAVQVTSSAAGTLTHQLDLIALDRVTIANPDLQPPAPPLFTSLVHISPGCAQATWLASGDPTVVGYIVSFGNSSVASGEATVYDHAIEAGNATSLAACSLPLGKHYFAVQTRNADGVVSAYSSERSVQVVTVSVLIAQFDARVDGEGVRLSWRVTADEVVTGYRVYRSEGASHEELLFDDLPPDATSFVDSSARGGSSYTYVLAAVRENGDEVRSIPASVTMPALALALEQNIPNPFNPTTRIPFSVDRPARVALRIYDVRGAHVVTLVDDDLPEGRHSADWSGVNAKGQPVASGVYLYTLTVGGRNLARKMLLMK
jgi:hypothetical protein